MSEVTVPYGFGATVQAPYDQAVLLTRAALAGEGFGVLTEIDVRATLRNKLDVDFRPYVILGACNPPLAHKALSAELEIGLLLPCNVVVRAADDPAHSVVTVMDPEAALSLARNRDIAPLAAEVRERLQRVLSTVVDEARQQHEIDVEC
ncbi:MAG TPA: DUF302 domain-containing protein [Longimicrobiales bacterium]|nr:DUF302 domain-containing protein [Longimicrobiales bacterium]